MLRTLLENGMSADLMNWQHQALLRFVCRPDPKGRNIELAGILLDAGADISSPDDEFASTPLAWAARTNAVQMAEFLLARGAPTNLPDDEPWATPLAWASGNIGKSSGSSGGTERTVDGQSEIRPSRKCGPQ